MSTVTVFTQSATTTISTSADSGPLNVQNYQELAVDINATAKTGTSPTIQFLVDRLGADGVWYNVWTSSVVSTVTTTISQSIGAGLTLASSFGGTVRFKWVLGGTTPTWTYSVSIIGK
jgi:hypothetical protein